MIKGQAALCEALQYCSYGKYSFYVVWTSWGFLSQFTAVIKSHQEANVNNHGVLVFFTKITGFTALNKTEKQNVFTYKKA